jgi:hypothetical protein
MRKQLFPLLIALSALAVSGSAAFYSVYGLSKLFAGASFQVMIMAGSLEFAKLVVASLLYQYWDTINKGLRAYLSIACFVLILITSGGIYGFLSGAYQSTANQSELLDKSLMILNQKQIRYEEQKQDLKIEKASLTKSISDLRIALSNPAQVQYIDKESGQLITTSSSSARRALQSELSTATTNRNDINIKIEAVMDSINKTDVSLLDKEISNEAESELGPLKYLAETTGQPMNRVVNWFLLLIIFVFDPLAIALVVAANMAFAQVRGRDSDIVLSVPEGMEFNKPYPIPAEWNEPSPELKQRVKANQDKIKSSITESIKIEKKDLVVDDLETAIKTNEKILGTAKVQNGLDAWIDVLEEEELLEAKQEEVKESVDTPIEGNESEHELYHGEVEKTDKEKLIGMVESKKNKSKKRVVKRPPPIARVKKSYKYRG